MKKINIKICDADEKIAVKNTSDSNKKIFDINNVKPEHSKKQRIKYNPKLILLCLFLTSVIIPLTVTRTQNAATIANLNFEDKIYNEKIYKIFPELFILKKDISYDTITNIENLIRENKLTADSRYAADNQLIFKFPKNIKNNILELNKNIEQNLKEKYIITEDFYHQIKLTSLKNQPQNEKISIFYATIKDYFIISKKLSDLEKTIENLTNN